MAGLEQSAAGSPSSGSASPDNVLVPALQGLAQAASAAPADGASASPGAVDAFRELAGGVERSLPLPVQLGAIAAVMGLLFCEQAFAVAGGAHSAAMTRLLDVSLVPLMGLFGLIMVERLAVILALI
jgi:hypothetical protein